MVVALLEDTMLGLQGALYMRSVLYRLCVGVCVCVCLCPCVCAIPRARNLKGIKSPSWEPDPSAACFGV